MSTPSIEECREKIDDIDQRIVKLLDHRQLIASKIQEIKEEEGVEIEDKGREQEVMDHVTSVLENEGLSSLIKDVWKRIFQNSKT